MAELMALGSTSPSGVEGLDLTGAAPAGERDGGAWQKEDTLQGFFLFKTCLCKYGTHNSNCLHYFSRGS